MPNREVIPFGRLERLATFQPSTFNENKRTMEVTFSTGARVMRSTWLGDRYIEELDMNEKSVRLDRFKRGAPVLNSHNRYSLDAVMGVVEDARIENGEGIARIRFSEREELQPLIRDIQNGIIRNVSVGYITHKVREDEEQDGIRVFRAVDWEPSEVSFVTVPADAAAQARSEDPTFQCEVEYRDRTQPENSNVEPIEDAPLENTRIDDDQVINNQEESSMPQEELDQVRNEGAAAERTRILGIRAAAKKAGLDDEFSTRLIDDGIELDKARELIIDEIAKRDAEIVTASANVEVGQDNTREYTRSGIEGAILNKFNAQRFALDDNAKRFRHLDLVGMAKECVRATGANVDMMDKHQIVKLALRAPGYHSSSDFPLALENVLNKSLQMGYMEAPRTWEPMTRSVTVSDFKQVSRVHVGEFSQLEQVLEGGEYKYGKIGERAEKYSISKYGKMVAVTWEMIVNDDMSAFTSLPAKLGKKSRDLESDKVWALLVDNTQIMAEDSLALFDAGHSNLNQGGAGAIGDATLAAMREKMRLHKDLDGTSPLNIFPSYLFVPASREVEATKYLTSITPRQAADVNVFGQLSNFSMQLRVEPRLDATANGMWLVTSDTSQLDMIEVARLSGEEAPSVSSREGFEVDGVEFKIRHLFVAHAIDYRGFQRNDGA